MSKQILLTTHQHKNIAILLENGVASEIVAEDQTTPSLVGNIYLGKVVRVLADSKMAFVDIGETRTALLHFNDCQKMPIQGTKHLVQVIKEPLGDKGARLSDTIRLNSQHLVYLPTQKNSLTISKKINDLNFRTQLINQLKGRLQGGVIVRTSAVECDNFDNQINELNKIWQQILSQKQTHYAKKQPQLLYQALPLSVRFVQDRADKDCWIIATNDAIIEQLSKGINHKKILKNNNLNNNFAVEAIINNALNKKIPLPSGGFLIIDETEAMTVIDVNAGTSNTPSKTNVEAVHAIAHAVRLKNLSGIIVIDFIDMPKSAQAGLINDLKLAIKNDKMKIKVYEFSRLGLLELTRERVFLPLSKIF